jgi:hypothetical protein
MKKSDRIEGRSHQIRRKRTGLFRSTTGPVTLQFRLARSKDLVVNEARAFPKAGTFNPTHERQSANLGDETAFSAGLNGTGLLSS